MSPQYDANEQTAKDMSAARERMTIDVVAVRDFLYNGRTEWDKKQAVLDILSHDPTFSKEEKLYMTRTQRYERGLRMVDRVLQLKSELGWSAEEESKAFFYLEEGLPIGLHSTAFEPVFNSQGSPELLAKYSRLIATRGIFGCYLQTELGHGSGVARLETTATYIPATQEFEINSPTLTSSKWWIGALGKTATHGVVQAKLIMPDGKDMGPHLFFVQLRSLDDHKLLPGIVAGDIGPKAMAGYGSVDNGFARFDHVRIPREQMLSKFAQVTPEGKYTKPPHAKISYGGMMYIRQSMVTAGGWLMGKAATVSIRYATVRRQGDYGKDGMEPQAITHPSLFSRLLPIISHAYVFIEVGRNLTVAFQAVSKRLATGDTSQLAEMHAITSGLKALVTRTQVLDLETARRSMGGHGYSGYAGLGRLYAEYIPSVTYEGDNFVLDLQVARSALKSYKAVKSAKQPTLEVLSPSSYYLRHIFDSSAVPPDFTDAAWSDPETLVGILEWRAALLVQELATNAAQPDANVHHRVSVAVAEAFVAAQVAGFIRGQKLGGESGKAVRSLYMLYLLTTVETSLADILSFGILRPSRTGKDATRGLRLATLKLYEELLPNAIGLTDAFGFSDWELDSALGVHDGKVYEALWNKAQTEPLNAQEVTDAYTQSIRPILERGQALAKAKM